MIRSKRGMVEIEGHESTLLADMSVIITSLKLHGIPESLILRSVAMGLACDAGETEDEKLAKEFVDKLMKKVMEKREAKDAAEN